MRSPVGSPFSAVFVSHLQKNDFKSYPDEEILDSNPIGVGVSMVSPILIPTQWVKAMTGKPKTPVLFNVGDWARLEGHAQTPNAVP